MPFLMVYKTKAVILAEISKATIQTDGLLEPLNDQMLKLALDEFEELQEAAAIRLDQYQKLTAQHYNSHIKVIQFWSLERAHSDFKTHKEMRCHVVGTLNTSGFLS